MGRTQKCVVLGPVGLFHSAVRRVLSVTDCLAAAMLPLLLPRPAAVGEGGGLPAAAARAVGSGGAPRSASGKQPPRISTRLAPQEHGQAWGAAPALPQGWSRVCCPLTASATHPTGYPLLLDRRSPGGQGGGAAVRRAGLGAGLAGAIGCSAASDPSPQSTNRLPVAAPLQQREARQCMGNAGPLSAESGALQPSAGGARIMRSARIAAVCL